MSLLNLLARTLFLFYIGVTVARKNYCNLFLLAFEAYLQYLKIIIPRRLSLCVLSCRFYGMSIWFPEYLRKLQSESYSSETAVEANHYIRNYIFNYSIENTNFESCVFHNVRFTGIVLNHVLFTNCSFINR